MNESALNVWNSLLQFKLSRLAMLGTNMWAINLLLCSMSVSSFDYRTYGSLKFVKFSPMLYLYGCLNEVDRNGSNIYNRMLIVTTHKPWMESESGLSI